MYPKNRYLIISCVSIVLMFIVERYLQPNYFLKSLLKMILFGGSIIYYLKNNDISFFSFINYKNFKYKKLSIGLAMVTFFGIIIGYFLIADFIDAKQITNSLLSKENITAQNFIFVAVYISLVNSFLEESFFRGLILKESNSFISAALFALYHIGIMTSWFKWYIFLLLILLLFIAGIILNFLTSKNDTFIASWLVHVAANLGINTIGFILLLG